jgi:hypothetical protein
VRLSDLNRCVVVDSSGAELGRVSDIRIIQDGPIERGVQAAFRVEALIVGKGGMAERLGFVRNRVTGPWLLREIFTRLEHRAKVVDVHDVERWDEEGLRLTLRAGATATPLGD